MPDNITLWRGEPQLEIADWGESCIAVFHCGTGDTCLLDNAGAAIVLALRDACGTLTVTEILSRVAEPESVESDDARAMIEHHLDELARRALVHRAPLDCH